MGIEDIPEMQLNGREEDLNGRAIYMEDGPFNLDKRPIDYNGKFIFLGEHDSPKRFVFSVNEAMSHQTLEENFQRIARERYGVQNPYKFKT